MEMNCIVCKQDTDYKSSFWVEVVCKTCEETLIASAQAQKAFYMKYNKAHAACPKCGETSHESTFAGYILNMDDKENYKDLNTCECTVCGDRHTMHERVPVQN